MATASISRLLWAIPLVVVGLILYEMGYAKSIDSHADDMLYTHGDRPSYAPDRIIFKLAPHASEPDGSAVLMSQGEPHRLHRVVQRYGFVKTTDIIRNPKPESLRDIHLGYLLPSLRPEEMLDELRSDPDVEWAEPDYYRYTSYTEPNDSRYIDEPHRRAHLDRIEAQYAWDLTRGDPNIVIAIIDTGIYYNHEDLFDNIWVNPGEVSDRNGDGRIDLHDIDLNGDRSISQDEIDANDISNGIDDDGNNYTDDVIGWDFVDLPEDGLEKHFEEDYLDSDNNPADFNGHGTTVAGAAAAVGNNGIGFAGVTWNSRIMILRAGYEKRYTTKNEGEILTSAISQAVKYAIDNGADIINMSFGGYDPCKLEQAVFNDARDNGCILVAAAGNYDKDSPYLPYTPVYPASYEGIISVAATSNLDDKRAIFFGNGSSNYGLCIDVSAPGRLVGTTNSDGGYEPAQGTSLSSPIVAGLAALVISSRYRDPDWSSEQTVIQIIATADDIDQVNLGYTGKLGAGRVNARKAVGQEFFGPRPKLISKIVQYIDDECEAGKRKAELYATIRNFGNSWGRVTATLKSADPNITIQSDKNTMAYEIIQSQRRMTNPDPYVICVDSDLPFGYNVAFDLDIYVNGIIIATEQFEVPSRDFYESYVARKSTVVLDPGDITTDPNSLFARWSLPGNPINYRYTVGRVPGQIDIYNWRGTPSSREIDMSCLPLVPNQQYYVSTKPRYVGGKLTIAFSAPIMYEPVSKQGAIRLSSDVYSSLDVVQITLADSDFRGRVLYNVTITTDGGDQETLTLTELNGLGLFNGSIETLSNTVVPEDGILQVRHGDTIAVTYEDMADGKNHPAPLVTAAIDCEAPVISRVEVDGNSCSKATIVFETDEPSCAMVHYGLSHDSLNNTAEGMWDPCHFTVDLVDLEPNTVYFFKIEAADKAGNYVIDDNAGNCFQVRTHGPVLFLDDNGTSPCIDAGDGSDYSMELPPNGDRVNMGAYGGTAEASLSP